MRPKHYMKIEHPKEIDITDAHAVAKEILDDDRWIKDAFSKHLSTEILQFSEILAECFKRFPLLDTLSSGGNEQAAFVSGYMFGVLDDLLVSMKLLVAGKMSASGNLMRQAIEGIAIAILCSTSALISVKKKKEVVKIKYWEKVKHRDPLVYAHLSIDHLESNCELLGASHDAIKKLRSARKHCHLFSHPGFMGMALRMNMDGSDSLYIGGSFDEGKLHAYKIEIDERIGLCGLLPNIIDGLISNLNAKTFASPVLEGQERRA